MTERKGQVIVSKIGIRAKIPEYDDFERINTTHNAKGDWKDLSPMNLGPFNLIEPLAENTNKKFIVDENRNLTYEIIRNQPVRKYYTDGILPGFEPYEDGQIAKCESFEAYWQHCGKIYKQDIKDGVVFKSFYERRATGLTLNLENTKAAQLRRTFTKQKGGVPVLSYYQGAFMDWVSSRILIYCPYYEQLVTETSAFQELKSMVDGGTNVQLLDPDGPSADDDLGPLDIEKLTNALYSTDRPFGHGMVLASLLLDLKVWQPSPPQSLTID